jgi:hypothetical protein
VRARHRWSWLGRGVVALIATQLTIVVQRARGGVSATDVLEPPDGGGAQATGVERSLSVGWLRHMPSELEPAMTDLRAIALTVLVTWLPLLLVVPCLAVWVFLLRGELLADDESSDGVEAGLLNPALPQEPDIQMHG